jgi:hypothetical protein
MQVGEIRGRRFDLGQTLCAAFVAIALTLISASSALAANGYIFDPVLSLNGTCSTTKADTVPDPGCPEGEHPPKGFTSVRSIATDYYGNIYVASYGNEAAKGVEGRIDIFDPSGFYIGEVPTTHGPKDLAIDSKGNLYVFEAHPGGGGKLVRYEPTLPYNPAAGEIEYDPTPVLVTQDEALFLQSIAVNADNDHVFMFWGQWVEEFGSAEEGNKFIGKISSEGFLTKSNGQGLAIDAAHDLLYAADKESIRVFELEAPHKLIRTITGAAIPVKFTSFASVAVDESTGNFFVFDGTSKKNVYEFLEDGTYVRTLNWKFEPTFGSEVSIDNGPFSPNSGFNSKGEAGYLFAPSEEGGLSQSLAFKPREEFPPEVKALSFADVTEEDAELEATINPGALETHYTFQYVTEEAFDKEGFAGADIAGEGNVPAGLSDVPVSAAATGLSAGTQYRFRVIATNSEGTDEAEGTFTTYLEEETILPCPNDATRTGLSVLLPDCRAYELVTPPDTNARAPRGLGKAPGIYFPSREVSPSGGEVSFFTEGGAIPGDEGAGSLSGDSYLSKRGSNGWTTASAGPNGVEAVAPLTGATSPDQGYSFWGSGPQGSAAVEGGAANYVRYPDGHSALIGRGSLDTDPRAEGVLISEGGSHIIFVSGGSVGTTAVQLEENAPPDGTVAIYDRTSDEITHVVSLLPGDVPQVAGQNALYEGASLDGRGVAFTIGKKLYLRFDNTETFEVGENVTFAGIAEGGARIFYVAGGDLFAFDAEEEKTIEFTDTGNVTPVNVSADGSAAYFVSATAIAVGSNPNGDAPQAGKENLYLSREGAVSFVATVTERDVEGEFGATETTGGLGLWTVAARSGQFAIDPSRATPDGSVLLFESRANLGGYDSKGHAQIYRYDSVGDSLECLSCNPTQAPMTSDASLQSILQELGGPEPFTSFILINNLRADGRRAFFQSSEALVQSDTDGLQDVYEWEANGAGTCDRPQGCVYLISSGQSQRLDYLYGVSDSGDDVFFRTSDLLLPLDRDETPSIYDARVGGGFPEPVAEPCQGEGCRPGLTPSPGLPTPGMLPDKESGNSPKPTPRPCAKGKRKVKRNGKVRCVKKHGKRKHRKAGSSKKGAGK